MPRADRAKGIVRALRSIATTPELFEAVTGAPFSHASAAGIRAGLDKTTRRDKKELAAVSNLRAAVRKNGYIEQSMIPESRPVLFKYMGASAPKKRLMRSNLPSVPQEVILKVAPQAQAPTWTVNTYERRTDGQYIGPIGKREVPLRNAFKLLAAESSGLRLDQTSTLQRMVGSYIRLGQVSVGTLLKVDHNFTRASKEVPGYEPSIANATWSLPLTLEQAYLGSTEDFPLFLEQ